MSYALVGCPSCKAIKGVEAGRRTTTCNRCGRKLEIARLRVLGRAETVEELQARLAALNALRADSISEMELVDRRKRGEPRDVEAAAARVPRSGGEAARAEALARSLTQELGGFDGAMFRSALEDAGIAGEKAEGLLQRMLDAGVLHEPDVGVYRSA